MRGRSLRSELLVGKTHFKMNKIQPPAVSVIGSGVATAIIDSYWFQQTAHNAQYT